MIQEQVGSHIVHPVTCSIPAGRGRSQSPVNPPQEDSLNLRTSPPVSIIVTEGRAGEHADRIERPQMTIPRRAWRTPSGILAGAAIALCAVAGPVVGAVPQPRVVVIVGPAGELTDAYRSIGLAAAREAAQWTRDVVTLFSPDATWPAARRALQGASVVVYLGHGNGFPSPYRTALYPVTENGLGLNPMAGVDDVAHQYFGESFLAADVHLAPHAAVLLLHLCYASGNSESGLPEPSLAVATQRVDNYAAGWLRAGADAVIADTFGPPGPYIRPLLTSTAMVDRIWRAAPTFHDNVHVFPSARTPGAVALLDPTRPNAGYSRSLVWRPGLRAGQVVGGAGTAPQPSSLHALVPPAPSLAAFGARVSAPVLTPAAPGTGLVAATRARLMLPIRLAAGFRLPDGVQLGVRWQPIPPGLTTGRRPRSSLDPPPAAPGEDSVPGAAPPAIELVVPETPAGLVTVIPARHIRGRLTVTVDLPAEPGRYRLVTTIHRVDGVAFDATSQELIPALSVKVSPPLSVAYGVAPALSVAALSAIELPVRLANDGAMPWADSPLANEDIRGPRSTYRPGPQLVARWLPLGLDASRIADPAIANAPRLSPGQEATVDLSVVAPSEPGEYLLVIDLLSPLHGSLAAAGAPPAGVRIGVYPAPAPRPEPARGPGPV